MFQALNCLSRNHDPSPRRTSAPRERLDVSTYSKFNITCASVLCTGLESLAWQALRVCDGRRSLRMRGTVAHFSAHPAEQRVADMMGMADLARSQRAASRLDPVADAVDQARFDNWLLRPAESPATPAYDQKRPLTANPKWASLSRARSSSPTQIGWAWLHRKSSPRP